ncbi:ABC transporter permease [Acidihalobacter aeolianus]|uniref:ABC transporter permease n=1 Tax=Acidihalobacter aeolianus TaxID=2792603 RepID=A0A1D8K6J3_9GAMM|nr:ABC transporter permease [Acidihalobacter aeolianus]AOV16597.1 ABC transporter permease [Acidihalobacter aeolianus]
MFARIFAVIQARNLEFLRDRAALAWNFALPLFVVLGFAFAYSGNSLSTYKVGVYGPHADSGFFATRYIRFVPVHTRDQGIAWVGHQKLDMFVDPGDKRYWINDSSPKGYLLARILAGSETQAGEYRQATVQGRQIGYVDWLIPGVLGMNMMFSALFGVGYVIVRYRRNGVLKRLKATPLAAFEFLAAQVLSRLWLMLIVTAIIFFGLKLMLGFPVMGSYLDLLLVFLLGSACLISLGMLVAARLRSEELAGGLLNAITWPMMFLSGVWFSLAGLNPWMQKIALIFPLTHIIHAARAIMLDGDGLAAIAPNLITLAVMTAVFLAVGAWSFRWE